MTVRKRKINSINLQSIPRHSKSNYIKLFVLNIQRKRAEKECEELKVILKQKWEQLREINDMIKRLNNQEPQKKEGLSKENNIISPKESVEELKWQNFKLDY